MAQGRRRAAPGEHCERHHKGGDKYGAPGPGAGFLLRAGQQCKSDWVKSDYGALESGGETQKQSPKDNFAT